MSDESLLVGWVRNRTDLRYFEESRWYRIPIDVAIAAPHRWRVPEWVAVMESASVSRHRQQVVRYARVVGVRQRSRQDLLGSLAPGPKAERTYYQLLLDSIQYLDIPLMPLRSRRGPAFIWTTLERLISASEFNDLFNDSPVENALWSRMKVLGIPAERQWQEEVDRKRYFLDFAIFCRERNIDVEVDGLRHHTISSNSIYDADRDQGLTRKGWAVHRIHAHDIQTGEVEPLRRLCETIEAYGGLPNSNVQFITRDSQLTTQLRLIN